MQQKTKAAILNLNEKIEIMPHIDHAFVMSPPQTVSAVIDEYKKYETENGVIVLHYLAQGSIKIRVCLTCYFQRKPDKFEIVSPNHNRQKYFQYFGHKTYKIKFIAFSYPDGSPWSQEKITSTLSCLFKLVKQEAATLATQNHPEKIIFALNGRRVTTQKTLLARLVRWLNS